MKIDKYINIIYLLILFGGIFFILRRLGIIKPKKLQSIKEKEKQKIEIIQAIGTIDYFKPNYYLKAKPNELLDVSKARNYAQELYKAMKGLGTDESRIYSIFSNLTHKAQVSQIAFHYQALYKKDLLTELSKELTKSELLKLYNITDALK